MSNYKNNISVSVTQTVRDYFFKRFPKLSTCPPEIMNAVMWTILHMFKCSFLYKDKNGDSISERICLPYQALRDYGWKNELNYDQIIEQIEYYLEVYLDAWVEIPNKGIMSSVSTTWLDSVFWGMYLQEKVLKNNRVNFITGKPIVRKSPYKLSRIRHNDIKNQILKTYPIVRDKQRSGYLDTINHIPWARYISGTKETAADMLKKLHTELSGQAPDHRQQHAIRILSDIEEYGAFSFYHAVSHSPRFYNCSPLSIDRLPREYRNDFFEKLFSFVAIYDLTCCHVGIAASKWHTEMPLVIRAAIDGLWEILQLEAPGLTKDDIKTVLAPILYGLSIRNMLRNVNGKFICKKKLRILFNSPTFRQLWEARNKELAYIYKKVGGYDSRGKWVSAMVDGKINPRSCLAQIMQSYELDIIMQCKPFLSSTHNHVQIVSALHDGIIVKFNSYEEMINVGNKMIDAVAKYCQKIGVYTSLKETILNGNKQTENIEYIEEQEKETAARVDNQICITDDIDIEIPECNFRETSLNIDILKLEISETKLKFNNAGHQQSLRRKCVARVTAFASRQCSQR